MNGADAQRLQRQLVEKERELRKLRSEREEEIRAAIEATELQVRGEMVKEIRERRLNGEKEEDVLDLAGLRASYEAVERQLRSQLASQLAEKDREIEELCESLRHTLAQELTVTDLARRFGMPVNAFIRRFQAGTGSTPYQYLTNLRYARAARLLEEGELSIDDICEAVGVKDRFHFSRMFKRLHGLSPAAYRRGYRPR